MRNIQRRLEQKGDDEKKMRFEKIGKRKVGPIKDF